MSETAIEATAAEGTEQPAVDTQGQQIQAESQPVEKKEDAKSENVLELLSETATEDDVKSFYEKLGAHSDAKNYDVKDVPSEFRERLAEDAKNMMLTPHQFNAYKQNAIAVIEQRQKEVAAFEADIMKEWGDKAEGNVKLVHAGIEALGANRENFEGSFKNLLNAVGNDKGALELLMTIGKFTNEGNGDVEGGGTGSASAESQLKALREDPEWRKAFSDGSHPKHKSAVEELDVLSKQIAREKQHG